MDSRGTQFEMIRTLINQNLSETCCLMHAPKGSNSSFVWHNIHEAKLVLNDVCHWMIGDGQNIGIFGDTWMANRDVINEADTHHFNPFLRMTDLLLASSKTWDGAVINELFPTVTASQILTTPLYTTVSDEQRMWWLETSGVSLVRSAYKLIMNTILDTGNLRVEGEWRSLWKLKIPPNVKQFQWRMCRDVLPARLNLRRRHMEVE